MLQHPHQHAFTPILQPSSSNFIKAQMGTQNNPLTTHLPRGTSRPSFAPVTAFHRARQKSFRPTRRGRWGALHICIAWKIYYHKLHERMWQKSSRLPQVVRPEHPAACLPDSLQTRDPDRASCRQADQDFPRGQAAEDISHRCNPSDLYMASLRDVTRKEKPNWEKPEQPLVQNRKEKEKQRSQQTDTATDAALRDKPQDGAATPERDVRLGGSLVSKRLADCDGFVKVKRAKQEVTGSQFHPCHTHIVPMQHANIRGLSDWYPRSSSCDVGRTPSELVSYPGSEMRLYQTKSWELMWDLHQSRQTALKDYSVNSCKAISIPLAAHRSKEAFQAFLVPPPSFPVASRQLEPVHPRGREFLYSCYENCPLH